MAQKNMNADEILAELRGKDETAVRGGAMVDMDHIDDLIRDILTKQKERELNKTSDQFTSRERREIEKEVRVQTNSLTRKLEKMQKEAVKARTTAIRVQLTDEVEEEKTEEPVSAEINLGMKTETFVALQQSRRQRAEGFVLDPAKPPQAQEPKTEEPKLETPAAPVVEAPVEIPAVKKEVTNSISAADLMAAAKEIEEKKAEPQAEPVAEEPAAPAEATEEPEAAPIAEETPAEAPVQAAEVNEAPMAEEAAEPAQDASESTVVPQEDEKASFTEKGSISDTSGAYLYEDDDEYVSPQQGSMIYKRLRKQYRQASVSRVITAITAVLGVLLAAVQFGSSDVWLLAMVRVSPVAYTVMNFAVMLIALLGSFPLFSGASRGSKKAAFSIIAVLITLASSLFFLFSPEALVTGYGVLYVPVMTLSLFASACGHVMRAKRILTNFTRITADEPMYGVILSDDNAVSREMTRGLDIEDEIAIAANVPVGFVDGFLTREQQPDPADHAAKAIMWTTLGVGAALAALVYFFTKDICAIITVFSGSATLGCGLILPVLCELPLHDSRAIFNAYESTLPDWTTAKETAEANCVMLNATDLFPEGSVVLHGIKTFQGTRIDTAIVDAASVVCKADSVLRDTFLYIINNRTELLKPVDTIRYEDLMGLTAWVDEKRVLIGNRDLMINHSIAVPKRGYEEPYEEQGFEVVYLAKEGELYAAFIIEFTAAEKPAAILSMMQRRGLTGTVRSVDSSVTPKVLERVFGLTTEDIKILPARLHEAFADRHKMKDRAETSLINRGDSSAFVITAAACKQLLKTVKTGRLYCFIAAILLPLILAAFLILNWMTAASAAVMGAGTIVFFLLYWFKERNTKL